MVYCTNCGKKNPDDAEKCSKCGEPLNKPSSIDRAVDTFSGEIDRAVDTCFGEPRRRYERDACFGIPSTILPFLFGGFIILWGISFLLQSVYHVTFEVWPIFVVVLGLIIIVVALFRRR